MAPLSGSDEEEAGDAEAEEDEGQDRVWAEPPAAVLRPADHAEAVDRGQRDAERGEPGVEVPRRREHRLPRNEVGDEEEADLKRVAAEDVSHCERVVAEPNRGEPGADLG